MATTNTAKTRGPALSSASEYEQLFKTRHRGPGRPSRDDGSDEPLFPSSDLDPILVRTAERRAFAVVHEENRERLRAIYHSELAVLKRRGPEQVAADTGRRGQLKAVL